MHIKPLNLQELQDYQEIHHGLCHLGHLVYHYSRRDLGVPGAPLDQGVPVQHGKNSLVTQIQRKVKLW